MLGAIIGDVAGSTYEVDEIKAIKNNEVNYSNRIKILDKNTPLFVNESSYTDDTILTCAIANAVLTDRNYYKNLKEWFDKYNNQLDNQAKQDFKDMVESLEPCGFDLIRGEVWK